VKEKLTFTTGCAINADMYYMACSPDTHRKTEDTSHTVMCFYQHQTADKWFFHELPGWLVVSAAYPEPIPGSAREIYALSEQGDVERYSRNGSYVEVIPDAGTRGSESTYGYVSRIRNIDGNLYVCGSNGQVYLRGANGWAHFDKTLLQSPLVPASLKLDNPEALLAQLSASLQDSRDLVDINGLNERDLYVVGSDGFIAHRSKTGWSILEKLTAASLNSIHIMSTDDVWIVGSRGTVLRGSARNGFKVISRKTLDVEFHCVTSFLNDFYIGASDGIYSMANGKPEKLQVSIKENLSEIASIESKEGVLWALSPKKLLRFDGKTWEVFEHPNNK
jgi:hypothetical protein